MKCIGCNSDEAVVVLMEIFPCKHCDGEIKIEYNVCKECGGSWKSVDGELLSNTTFFDVGLGEFFDDDDDEIILNVAPIIDCTNSKVYMGDYVHRCLKCQVICYEVEENLYECPECGFSWEVIKNV